MFWKPTVAIEGDAGNFLVSLQQSLSGYKADPEWSRSLKERDTIKEQANRSVVKHTAKLGLSKRSRIYDTNEMMITIIKMTN